MNIGGGLDKIRSMNPESAGSSRTSQAKPDAQEFSSLINKPEINQHKPNGEEKFKRFGENKRPERDLSGVRAVEASSKNAEPKDNFKISKTVTGEPSIPSESGEVPSKIVNAGSETTSPDVTEKTFRKDGLKKVDESEESNQSTSRPEQEAMLKFMMSMNKELGVKPEEVISAMGSLSDESLLQSPEDTMSEVIQKLDLAPGKQARAVELYQTMLKETAEASMKNWAEKSGKQVDVKLMGPDQLREQRTMDGVERMSEQFFPVVKQGVQQKDSQDDKEAIAMFPVKEETNLPEAKSGLTTKRSIPSKIEVPVVQQSAVGDTATKAYNAQSKMTEQAVASQKNIDQGVAPSPLTNISPALLAATQNISDGRSSILSKDFESKSDQATDTVEIKSAPAPVPNSDAAALSAGLSGKASLFSRDQESDSKDNGNQESSPLNSVAHSKEKSSLTPENITLAPAAQTKIPTADEAANIRTIIQSSRYLVQRGGGEMKVQLQPEGMGNIDLKVAINNGKVDIQMMTESKETKRMLESGMDDLRASLVQHKLSLDNVRVDTHNKSGTESNNNNNFFNQEREQARDFLGQFRDSNGAQRNFDNIDLKSYNPSGRKLRPEAAAQTQRAKSSAKRLDLVA